jgi:hypothetical protein
MSDSAQESQKRHFSKIRPHVLVAAVDTLDKADWRVSRPFELYERVASVANLAFASWHYGDADNARSLIRRTLTDAAHHGDPPTLAYARMFETMFECRNDNATRTLAAADALVGIGRQYGMSYYLSLGQVLAS